MNCLTCEKAVTFSEMKVHRLSCNGNLNQLKGQAKVKKMMETATVNGSVQVRPETSAESAALPAEIHIDELNYEDTDKEWKLIKEPAQAAKVYKESAKGARIWETTEDEDGCKRLR
ncbi:uncharacterized protein LOC144036736 isoform X3 [Vanacampus margaritifer]